MYHYAMTQWIVGNEPLESSMARLCKYGYDGIEFAAEPYSLDASECRTLMQKYHLNCRSLCGIFGEDRDLTADGEAGDKAVQYLTDSIDFAVGTGAGVLIVVPSPVGRTAKPKDISREKLEENAVRNIRRGADYAEKNGIKLAIECINRYETYFVNTLEQGMDLVRKIDHPAVGIMADLFHMSIEERSLSDGLYLVQDKLLHVHIADNTREAAGMGHTDFKEVLRTLNRIHYKGSLTMEFMYRLSDPYAATEITMQSQLMDAYARQSIEYMKALEKSIDPRIGG